MKERNTGVSLAERQVQKNARRLDALEDHAGIMTLQMLSIGSVTSSKTLSCTVYAPGGGMGIRMEYNLVCTGAITVSATVGGTTETHSRASGYAFGVFLLSAVSGYNAATVTITVSSGSVTGGKMTFAAVSLE